LSALHRCRCCGLCEVRRPLSRPRRTLRPGRGRGPATQCRDRVRLLRYGARLLSFARIPGGGEVAASLRRVGCTDCRGRSTGRTLIACQALRRSFVPEQLLNIAVDGLEEAADGADLLARALPLRLRRRRAPARRRPGSRVGPAL